MSYQALYRVWRPQQLKDIAGQEHITKTLQNALVQEKLSHAYLFTGPRGTGKTSAAKIVSKAINCEKAPVKEPCNECSACLGISDGSITDVIEIDAASNTGVDDIRDIRDKVKFAPNEVKYKVYIIDEVHMLSTGAFNALLKTLEEPPKHVIFILATTEPHKIPLTIISRCQRFDFKRITSRALVARMEYILSHYDVKVHKEAIELVAASADGGMRDALSILDQAISYSEEEVTLESVLSITGAVSQTFLRDVVLAVEERDVISALKAVERMVQEGKDPQRFLEDIIFYFRDMLLFQAAPELEEVVHKAIVDSDFREMSERFQASDIYEIIHLLNESQQEMKWASHPKIFLELALVRLCNRDNKEKGKIAGPEIDQFIKRIDELERKIKQLEITGVEVSSQNETKQKQSSTTSRRPVAAGGMNKVVTSQVKEVLSGASKLELQRVTSAWGKVMERVKQESVPAHAWLSDCKPVAASQKAMLLAFQNEMHRDMVDTKFRDVVEKIVFEVMQQHMVVFTLLSAQWEKLKEEYVREQRSDSEERSEPLIEEAVKLVGNDLIEIIE